MMVTRHYFGAILFFVATTLSACAPASALPSDAPVPAPPPPVVTAPIAPPIYASPSQAFVEGYRAYKNHNLATAIDRFSYSAEHFPRLADYSLYYLGLCQRDSGDLNASAITLDRDVRTYPESATFSVAEVALSD